MTGDMPTSVVSPTQRTMNLSPIDDQALELVIYAGKWAVAVGAIYALVEKVGKPYYDWRKKRWITLVHDALNAELQRIDQVKNKQLELVQLVELVLGRQKEMFEEMDMFMDLSIDNRNRHDETNDLLTACGFSSDRRMDMERRKEIDNLFRELNRRKVERRRLLDHPILAKTL